MKEDSDIKEGEWKREKKHKMHHGRRIMLDHVRWSDSGRIDRSSKLSLDYTYMKRMAEIPKNFN